MSAANSNGGQTHLNERQLKQFATIKQRLELTTANVNDDENVI